MIFWQFLAAKEWIMAKWMEIDQDDLRTVTAIGSHASHEHQLRFLVQSPTVFHTLVAASCKFCGSSSHDFIAVCKKWNRFKVFAAKSSHQWPRLLLPVILVTSNMLAGETIANFFAASFEQFYLSGISCRCAINAVEVAAACACSIF